MLGLDNPVHLAFLLLIVLLVFGAKRLPEMGRSLGAGMRGFKESISGEQPTVHLEQATAAPVTEAQSAKEPVAEPATLRPAS